MEKLKYLEKIYYKTIIDLLNTMSNYNFKPNTIVLKVSDVNSGKLLDNRFSDLNSIRNYYIQNGEINMSGNICGLGDTILLNTFFLTSEIFNSNITYYIIDASGNFKIQKKYNETLSTYDSRFIQNQYDKIVDLLTKYTKIYSFIEQTKDFVYAESYSACYAVKGWTEDGASKMNYDVFFKYNLFDLNIATINDEKDLAMIRRIGL